MASGQIIFYDLPSRPPCKTWTPNPWKTRLLLNFKKLDYRTEWVEYPDVKPKFEAHVAPNESGTAYTIPTIQLPDGTYIMESRKIANHIESIHPSPPLHLDSPYLSKIEALMPQVMGVFRAAFLPLVPVRLLNERSQGYWYETRERMVGMPLDKLDRAKGLKDVVGPLKEVSKLLREKEGPFFMGEEVSYADLVFVAFLRFAERIGDDLCEPVMSVDKEAFGTLLERCREWLARDDQ